MIEKLTSKVRVRGARRPLYLPSRTKLWCAPAERTESPLLFLLYLGCALTFASEAKFEIEAKILLRLEANKKPDFT
jgi:hypothetical protein